MSINKSLQNTNVSQVRIGKNPATTLYNETTQRENLFHETRTIKNSIKFAIKFGLELKKTVNLS